MGTEYYIACHSCKKIAESHKNYAINDELIHFLHHHADFYKCRYPKIFFYPESCDHLEGFSFIKPQEKKA